MSAFFVVSTADDAPPEHFQTLEEALAEFLRLLNEAEAESITLEFSS